MLCASCLRAGTPDTWIPGSDRVEAVAWCCLGLPGLLYCGWRYLARAHVCAACGSPELIREARASRRPARFERRMSRLHSEGGRAWPLAFADPVVRLRGGAWLAAAGCAALALAAAGWLEPGASSWAPASGLWSASWVFGQIALLHDGPPPCRAWSDDGRALSVEWLQGSGRVADPA